MAAEAEKDISTPSEEVHIAKKEDAKTTTSDNDTANERPVRRKLKETRITSDSHAAADGTENSSDDGSAADRGRLTKKRSRDDMQADEEDDVAEQDPGHGHRRKRSRDSKDDEDLSGGKEGGDARKSTPDRTQNDESSHILSPKKKRSLDQLVKDSENTPNEDKENVKENDKSQAEGEREKKRHRDASEERRDAAAASTKVS
jgi:Ran-binding protein 3